MSKSQKAFDYPTREIGKTSKPPVTELNNSVNSTISKNIALINLVEGKSDFKAKNFNHYGGKINISYNNIEMPRKYNQKGRGRTINVPKNHSTVTVPKASFNGAITTGETCIGNHCAMPVTPTATNYVSNNLSSANPAPGGNLHIPGTDRLGNNHVTFPGSSAYSGSELNHGPHNIQCTGQKGGNKNSFEFIVNPLTNRKVSIYGKLGRKILNNYQKAFNNL